MTIRPLEPARGIAAPTVLAISDRSLLTDVSVAEWVAALAQAGVDTLQIREKDLDDRSLFRLVERACAAAAGRMRIVVNGRLDVALAAGAVGVHLPTDGVDAGALRQRFGSGLLIGCSTHHPDEVAAARDAGADYVTFGPVWDTPSKRAYGPPPGLKGLRRACASDLPVLALGGVRTDRLQDLADAGAAGFAAIRAFARLSDLPATLRAADEVWPRRAALARMADPIPVAAWPPTTRPDTLAPSASERTSSKT